MASPISTFYFQLLWYGVIATSAPGIAGEYPFQGKPSPFERAMFTDGLQAVIGAGGLIAALAAHQR